MAVQASHMSARMGLMSVHCSQAHVSASSAVVGAGSNVAAAGCSDGLVTVRGSTGLVDASTVPEAAIIVQPVFALVVSAI